MTVCLAAICEYNRVIGVSDRMITAGDIEFEPPQSKMWELTNSICAMTAGDTTLQTEIMLDVEILVNRRVVEEPENWWRVRDVAALYRSHYEQARLRRGVSAILAPLGMDLDTFIARQSDMDEGVVATIIAQLTNYPMPGVQAIFAGVDNDGPPILKTGAPGVYPHIYVSNGGETTCHDGIGFAAIGFGDWHAQSQFMFARHTRSRPFPETLFLAYSAKKHAEVAPGVGKDTDIFSIGRGLGTHFMLGSHVLDELERHYQASREAIDKANAHAEQSFRKYLNELPKKRAERQASPPNPSNEPDPQHPTDDPQPQPSSPE